MADNLTLPATSSVVSTDEVTRNTTTQHVQFVKLMDGTENSAAQIGGDATNGLDVDVTRLPKGSKTVTLVSASTTATQLLAANTARKSVIIQNNGTTDVYLGKDSSVTYSSGGFLLRSKSVLTDDSSSDAWWAITFSGTTNVNVIEVA